MAYTDKDIAALKAAIATGATKVRFADNREVTYRTLAEMRSILAGMQAEVTGRGQTNRYVAGYRSNLS
ncbi:hypothetical protein ASF28_08975 [Methylobacterium sp. Leaf99]|uniref:phage head-tail joining protein n=1 Tax=Methylobacterium sp. Leaf99 TaxID=1736251 RepID=UPI000701AC4A|nr:hypothetical protein [Methylobacterium sp. Leaf99]KQP11166.1 hypothetical protein ASF28_08975 [Methylobacterium sp. Leaf99]